MLYAKNEKSLKFMAAVSKAVFLDRDGVLNEPILNPKTSEFESPHAVSDLHILPGVFEALKDLQKYFKLFVVTNQPSYAKGKVTLEVLEDIAANLKSSLEDNEVRIQEYYYCFHHPESIYLEFRGCECRKPSPFFLKKAAQDFNLDMKNSWMIGDRDTDIQSGKAAGCKTILIENVLSKSKQGKEKPTEVAKDILTASKIILALSHEGDSL
jgi:D-glycero-D-manno-heptose 1,7-bisphosphate phosphatase